MKSIGYCIGIGWKKLYPYCLKDFFFDYENRYSLIHATWLLLQLSLRLQPVWFNWSGIIELKQNCINKQNQFQSLRACGKSAPTDAVVRSMVSLTATGDVEPTKPSALPGLRLRHYSRTTHAGQRLSDEKEEVHVRNKQTNTKFNTFW